MTEGWQALFLLPFLIIGLVLFIKFAFEQKEEDEEKDDKSEEKEDDDTDN